MTSLSGSGRFSAKELDGRSQAYAQARAGREVAAARFLSGEESSYMAGQSIVVDGVWIVQGISEAPQWL